jgi:hypothetical protein
MLDSSKNAKERIKRKWHPFLFCLQSIREGIYYS